MHRVRWRSRTGQQHRSPGGGDNLFLASILALNPYDGTLVWHYQTVRHDLWDYDLPAQPNLVTLRRDGRRVDAVAQITKTGHVFVFDRESGAPLFPIEERAVPASDLDGEQAWRYYVCSAAQKRGWESCPARSNPAGEIELPSSAV